MAEESKDKKSFHLNPAFWQVLVVVLIGVVIVSIITSGFGITGKVSGDGKNAGNTVVSSINEILSSQGRPGDAKLITTSAAELYKVDVEIENNTLSYYTNPSGEMLYPASGLGVINLTELIDLANQPQPSANDTTTPPATTVAKSDKPEVDLYVMAFCPYGVQAEQAMKPVVDLLGSKANFNIKFIVNIGGTTPDSVQSLHGAFEANEDLRQVCIRNSYNQSTYWNYVSQIANNCYADARNSIDTCWRASANASGINTTLIENCFNTTAVGLLTQDETATNSYGVSGSPTLIINGQKVSPARTPDGFKQAVCDAFNTAPAECGQTLSSTGSAAQGGCG